MFIKMSFKEAVNTFRKEYYFWKSHAEYHPEALWKNESIGKYFTEENKF